MGWQLDSPLYLKFSKLLSTNRCIRSLVSRNKSFSFLRGKTERERERMYARTRKHTHTLMLAGMNLMEPNGGQRTTQELVLSCHLVESRDCTLVIRHKGLFPAQA